MPEIEEILTATRRPAGTAETVRANRGWWDAAADEYQADHGPFLGDSELIWGPEGLDEARAGLLGEVRGNRVLEVGCGAGQCSRWLAAHGGTAVGVDLSWRQLRHGRRIDAETGQRVVTVQADAGRLPFDDGSFDLACSSFGALPFVADAATVLAEVARVLRGGGRFVFSTVHPMRWVFPDDPGPEGLVATDSYFDRRAYVEEAANGSATYVEHHRTMGDWVRAIVAAGFVLTDLVEPTWSADTEHTWGGWSALRGRHFPGTAIFSCDKPT